jgi:hypothetical protein
VVPPLRERKEDIPLLIEGILATTPGGEGAYIAAETIDLMMKHDWPGNVRELRNVRRQVGDRRQLGQLLDAPAQVGPDLVVLRVDGLQADLHLGRDRLGLEPTRVVQVEELPVLLAELVEDRVQVRPPLLVEQHVERGAIVGRVRIVGGIEPVAGRAPERAAQEVVGGVDRDDADPRAELGAAARVVAAELVHVVAQEPHQDLGEHLVGVRASPMPHPTHRNSIIKSGPSGFHHHRLVYFTAAREAFARESRTTSQRKSGDRIRGRSPLISLAIFAAPRRRKGHFSGSQRPGIVRHFAPGGSRHRSRATPPSPPEWPSP